MSRMNRTRYAWRALLPAALFLLLALLTSAQTPPEAAASSFRPQTTWTLSDDRQGAASDVTWSVSIPAPDAMLAEGFGFTNQSFFLATDADSPIGAIVGKEHLTIQYSGANYPCSSTLTEPSNDDPTVPPKSDF